MTTAPQQPLRVPPHSNQAEQAVLGSMLLSPEAIERVEHLLRPEEFYKLRHQILFRTMLELADKGEAVDLVTLEAALASKGQLEEVGGMNYLQELFSVIPTTANVEQYARIVRHKSLLRRLIEVSANISSSCYEEIDDLETLLDRTEAEIFQVTQSRVSRPYFSMKEVITEAYEVVGQLVDRREAVTGIGSGIKDLDDITAGFQPSDLIILAARPSMGKTALCLSWAVNMGVYGARKPVLMFSLEMSRTQLAFRLLAMESRIDMQQLRRGMLREEHWSNLTTACGILSEAPIYIDDSPQISLREMRSKARRLKAEHDLGIIVVDYLQLMEVRDKKVESRQLEISQISRGLKALARELNIPVIALSQLSRKVEDRNEKRPMLSDLRESGAIEQDADLVMFIYREDRYKENTEEKGIAEIIVAKQRNGPLGTVRCHFNEKIGKFSDLARAGDF
ncbi:MAG: replicative DNA helicase [Candidatus Riflebacteria bacterium]|nr:replicative DNA helicase [Candidatus Riflebacteria bacterium]